MPKRLSSLVNIMLNYGFIENSRHSRSVGAQKGIDLKKRNICTQKAQKSVLHVEGLDLSDAARAILCLLWGNLRGSFAIPAALSVLVNDIKN